MEYGDAEYWKMDGLYGGRGQKARDIPETDREKAYEYFSIMAKRIGDGLNGLMNTKQAMEETGADAGDLDTIGRKIDSVKTRLENIQKTRRILSHYMHVSRSGEREGRTAAQGKKPYSRSRTQAQTSWEERSEKISRANRAVIGKFLADNGLMHTDMHGVPMHSVNFDEKSGKIYDNTASGTVIGTFAIKDGQYTDIKPYDEVIAKIRDVEKEAIREAAEKNGTDDGLTITYRRGMMEISSGEDEKPVKTVKFSRIPVKSRGFRFEEKEGQVIAKAKTGMEKVAGKMMEPADAIAYAKEHAGQIEMLSYILNLADEEKRAETEKKLAAEAERSKEKVLDSLKYTYDGEEYDRTNFRRRLVMALSPVTEMLGIKASDYTIHQDIDGSGYIKAPGRHGEITVGEISKDLEGTIYTEEQIKEQEDILEKADVVAGRSLFVKPEETKAFRLEFDRAGEYFATFDYNGKMSLNGEVPHSVEIEGKRKANLEQSMEHFAEISGVDRNDLVFVDGCSYVVTTSGKAVGILGSEGQVIADEEMINGNRERVEEAERSGKSMTEIGQTAEEEIDNLDAMADEYAAMMQEAEDARNDVLDAMTEDVMTREGDAEDHEL